MQTSRSRRVGIYTQEAVAAVFAHRPGCARSLYYTPEQAHTCEPWRAFLAEKGEYARQCTPQEIESICPAAVKEGLYLETERPLPRTPSHSQAIKWQRRQTPLLCLDGCCQETIGRVAAWALAAGFSEMILAERQRQCLPDSAAYARAQGALEAFHLHQTGSMRHFLKDLHRRFLTVGISAAGRPLEKLKPPRAPGRPVALLWSDKKTSPYPCELTVQLKDTAASAPAFFRILQAAVRPLE